MSTIVTNIKRHNGIAGQVSVTADVAYLDEYPTRQEFAGSVYGGPVVAVLSPGHQVFVVNHERHGSFGADPVAWLRRYYVERGGAEFPGET